MLVDYGIFHLLLHTRSIEGGNLFWVLLWMSMSYGITNFAWIWLWLSKDKHLFEWSLLIWLWWIAAPMLAATFGAGLEPIKIQRTTGAYHGYMALILFVSYAAAIVYNLLQNDFPCFGCWPSGYSSNLHGNFPCSSAASEARSSLRRAVS